MLGLVLWCDGAARRAVIWCEDHGDLAWYEAADAHADGASTPVCAGDLVQVDVRAIQGMRRARALRVVVPGAGADLPGRLTQAAG